VSVAVDGIFAALQGIEPRSPSAAAFYDDSVRQLNAALAARRDRLDDARRGLPWVIGALLFVGSLVIVGSARDPVAVLRTPVDLPSAGSPSLRSQCSSR